MLHTAKSSSSLPVDSLTYAFRRLAQVIQTHSWSHSTSFRLTPTQQRVIDVLSRRAHGLSLSVLAREIGISPATTNECVGALQSKGLVEKRGCETDRRKVVVLLTDQGVTTAATLADNPDPFHEGFATLEESERRRLYRSLLKVICVLERRGALSFSRTCLRCKFFDPSIGVSSKNIHHCRTQNMNMSDLEVRMDCPTFEACDPTVVESLYKRFESVAG